MCIRERFAPFQSSSNICITATDWRNVGSSRSKITWKETESWTILRSFLSLRTNAEEESWMTFSQDSLQTVVRT